MLKYSNKNSFNPLTINIRMQIHEYMGEERGFQPLLDEDDCSAEKFVPQLGEMSPMTLTED